MAIGQAKAKQGKPKDLSLLGHLRELRTRLVRSVIVFMLTCVVSFIFARHLFDVFKSRAPAGTTFVYTGVADMAGAYLKVCMYSGLVLALPWFIFELVMFIHPALTRKEKTYLYILLPGVLFFFMAGAIFSYYIILPPALKFLIDFPLVSGITPMIGIDNYISVVTKVLVAMGLIFELPMVIFFLAKIGVVTPEWLSKYRGFAIVGAFVIAAAVTPTFDPLNQTLFAAPIIVLYEIGIILAKVAQGKLPFMRRKAKASN